MDPKIRYPLFSETPISGFRKQGWGFGVGGAQGLPVFKGWV